MEDKIVDFNQYYKAYCITKEGNKTELNAENIIIELAPDKEIKICLKAHPFGLSIGDCFDPKSDDIPTHYSVIAVRPGACNIIHVDIDERHPFSEKDRKQIEGNA